MFEESPGYVSQTNISANKQSKNVHWLQSKSKTHKLRQLKQVLLQLVKNNRKQK